jgi:hypothetical protein
MHGNWNLEVRDIANSSSPSLRPPLYILPLLAVLMPPIAAHVLMLSPWYLTKQVPPCVIYFSKDLLYDLIRYTLDLGTRCLAGPAAGDLLFSPWHLTPEQRLNFV